MNKRTDGNFALDELLHPANAFGHPSEVVNVPDLTLNEKRAILASWASDACAIEAAPELRSGPHGQFGPYVDDRRGPLDCPALAGCVGCRDSSGRC
jgi:hypothetical protein